MPAVAVHRLGQLDEYNVAAEEDSEEDEEDDMEEDDEEVYSEEEDSEEAKADYFERIGRFLYRIDETTWAAREVHGTHCRPCTYCGYCDWQPGEFYIKERELFRDDEENPIKVCEGCIEYWLDEHGADADSESEPDQEEFFQMQPYSEREVDGSDFSESGEEEYEEYDDEGDGGLAATSNGAESAGPSAASQPPGLALLPVIEDRLGSRPGEQERRIVY